MERYSVFDCIQSECREMRTRETPNTGTFHAIIVADLVFAKRFFSFRAFASNVKEYYAVFFIILKHKGTVIWVQNSH